MIDSLSTLEGVTGSEEAAKFKNFSELPDALKDKMTELPDGSFVTKTAAEAFEIAAGAARYRNYAQENLAKDVVYFMRTGKVPPKVSAMAVLYEDAKGEDAYREYIARLEKRHNECVEATNSVLTSETPLCVLLRDEASGDGLKYTEALVETAFGGGKYMGMEFLSSEDFSKLLKAPGIYRYSGFTSPYESGDAYETEMVILTKNGLLASKEYQQNPVPAEDVIGVMIAEHYSYFEDSLSGFPSAGFSYVHIFASIGQLEEEVAKSHTSALVGELLQK